MSGNPESVIGQGAATITLSLDRFAELAAQLIVWDDDTDDLAEAHADEEPDPALLEALLPCAGPACVISVLVDGPSGAEAVRFFVGQGAATVVTEAADDDVTLRALPLEEVLERLVDLCGLLDQTLAPSAAEPEPAPGVDGSALLDAAAVTRTVLVRCVHGSPDIDGVQGGELRWLDLGPDGGLVLVEEGWEDDDDGGVRVASRLVLADELLSELLRLMPETIG